MATGKIRKELQRSSDTSDLFGAGYHAVHGVSKDFSYLAAGFYSPQPFRFHRPVK